MKTKHEKIVEILKDKLTLGGASDIFDIVGYEDAATAIEQLEPEVDWNKLRERYFEECCEIKPSCYVPPPMDVPKSMKRVALAPHDLFEWFKRNTPPPQQPSDLAGEEVYAEELWEKYSELQRISIDDIVGFQCMDKFQFKAAIKELLNR